MVNFIDFFSFFFLLVRIEIVPLTFIQSELSSPIPSTLISINSINSIKIHFMRD